jgi:hypothetical protein
MADLVIILLGKGIALTIKELNRRLFSYIAVL